MRHRKSNVKLGRTASHRRALLRNLATSLFTHLTIRTTIPKIKALKPVIDKLVGHAKKGTLASHRALSSYLTRPDVVTNLIFQVREHAWFADRDCGYTKTGRLGFRKGDAAPMGFITLLTTPQDLEQSDHPSKAETPEKTDKKQRERRVAASQTAKGERPEKKKSA
ncbi:MAG: 50S ribosomal protein L17 [Deltaproteobacteria bacterium]|jgi:large subunit ribosomal protein L17|nr:50S ribosomal protein L17 [Deltaproteobacteria bacterium]